MLDLVSQVRDVVLMNVQYIWIWETPGGRDFGMRGIWVSVPDKRSRNIPEVVVVRRWAVGVLGIWRGRVWVKGGTREGQFTSNLRLRWTIPVTARRVPSK